MSNSTRTDDSPARSTRLKSSVKPVFSCNLCGYTCRSDAGIYNHLKKNHGKSGKGTRQFYTASKDSDLTSMPEKPRKKLTRHGGLPGLKNLPFSGQLKFVCPVDIEVDLSSGTCRILPKDTAVS